MGKGFSIMFKKVLIATLAVVVGLAVIKGTWLGSTLCMKFRKASTWVKNQVPPEQEIQRLRMELSNLAREDEKHFDKVARLAVDVDNAEKAVTRLRTNIEKQEGVILKRKADLADAEFVKVDGVKYTKTDLRLDAIAFKNAEENLKSQEARLDAQKRLLTLERKKLGELKNKRDEMATELQKLETALVEERQAQAASESTIDDSSYRQIRKDMNSLRDKIEVLKKKRQLRGEFQPTVDATKPTEQDVQADKYLETRFGGKKEVVSEKSDK
jgi:predicted  nucleic acid-binding Zn-ribbon protein